MNNRLENQEKNAKKHARVITSTTSRKTARAGERFCFCKKDRFLAKGPAQFLLPGGAEFAPVPAVVAGRVLPSRQQNQQPH